MDNLIDLLIQRRRWINSSYFAFDYVFKNYDFDVR
jgi:cellulose synthase/poly-beta-1,6-N-acetylglucosamine synthase-like glycosyltransferase